MNGQVFCPLIEDECRRECCAWFHCFTIISPDGIDQCDYCAVSVIANMLCDLTKADCSTEM